MREKRVCEQGGGAVEEEQDGRIKEGAEREEKKERSKGFLYGLTVSGGSSWGGGGAGSRRHAASPAAAVAGEQQRLQRLLRAGAGLGVWRHAGHYQLGHQVRALGRRARHAPAAALRARLARGKLRQQHAQAAGGTREVWEERAGRGQEGAGVQQRDPAGHTSVTRQARCSHRTRPGHAPIHVGGQTVAPAGGRRGAIAAAQLLGCSVHLVQHGSHQISVAAGVAVTAGAAGGAAGGAGQALRGCQVSQGGPPILRQQHVAAGARVGEKW